MSVYEVDRGYRDDGEKQNCGTVGGYGGVGSCPRMVSHVGRVVQAVVRHKAIADGFGASGAAAKSCRPGREMTYRQAFGARRTGNGLKFITAYPLDSKCMSPQKWLMIG